MENQVSQYNSNNSTSWYEGLFGGFGGFFSHVSQNVVDAVKNVWAGAMEAIKDTKENLSKDIEDIKVFGEQVQEDALAVREKVIDVAGQVLKTGEEFLEKVAETGQIIISVGQKALEMANDPMETLATLPTLALDKIKDLLFGNTDFAKKKEELYKKLTPLFSKDGVQRLRKEETRIAEGLVGYFVDEKSNSYLREHLQAHKKFYCDYAQHTLLKIFFKLQLICAKGSQLSPALLAPHELLWNAFTAKADAFQPYAEQLSKAHGKEAVKAILRPFIKSILDELFPERLKEFDLSLGNIKLLNDFVWDYIVEPLVTDVCAQVYEEVTAPQRRHQEHVDALVKDLGLQKEDGKMISAAAKIYAHDITTLGRRLLVDNKDRLVQMLDDQCSDESKLGADERAMLGFFIEKSASGDKSHGGIENLWGYIDQIVHTGIIRLVRTKIDLARKDTSMPKSGNPLADALLYFPGFLDRYFTPELTAARLHCNPGDEAALRALYKDATDDFMRLAFPEAENDLPIPLSGGLKSFIWKSMKEEWIPDFMAKAHGECAAYQMAEGERERKLKEAFKGSRVPGVFADVGAAFLQAYGVNYMKLIAEDDPEFAVEKAISYFANKGSPEADEVKSYLEKRKEGIVKGLKDGIRAFAGGLKTDGAAMNAARSYSKGAIQTILHAIKTTLDSKEKAKKELADELAAGVMRILARRLKAQREGATATTSAHGDTAQEQADLENLIEKWIQLSGVTPAMLHIPQDAWDMLKKYVLPEVAKKLMEEFVTPHTINVATRFLLKKYEQFLDETEGKDEEESTIEESPILNSAAEELLKELSHCSGNKIFKVGMKSKKIQQMLGSTLGHAIKEQIVTQGITGLMEQALVGLTEELVPGSKMVDGRLYDAAGNLLDGVYDHQFPQSDAEKAQRELDIEALHKKTAEEVRELAKKVGPRAVKRKIRNYLVGLWKGFSKRFSSLVERFLGKELGKKITKGLGVLCRALFITCLGSVAWWLSYPFRKLFDEILARMFEKGTVNAIAGIQSVFDKELISEVTDNLADNFKKVQPPKRRVAPREHSSLPRRNRA